MNQTKSTEKKERIIKELKYINGIANPHINTLSNMFNLIYKFELTTQDNNIFEIIYMLHYRANTTMTKIDTIKIYEIGLSCYYDSDTKLKINLEQSEVTKLQELIHNKFKNRIENKIKLHNTIGHNIFLEKENIVRNINI
jgi:hypothetical protein